MKHTHIHGFFNGVLADAGLIEDVNEQHSIGSTDMLLTAASPPGGLRDLQQAAVLTAMAIAALTEPGRRVSPMGVRSLIALIVLRIHATDIYAALTAGEIGAVEAAVKLSKAWPSAPASAQSYAATQLDQAKRRIEAQLIMMEPDPTGHLRPSMDSLEPFMDTYTAVGGDESTGTLVRSEIERWTQSINVSVPSINSMAEIIELFAQ